MLRWDNIEERVPSRARDTGENDKLCKTRNRCAVEIIESRKNCEGEKISERHKEHAVDNSEARVNAAGKKKRYEKCGCSGDAIKETEESCHACFI